MNHSNSNHNDNNDNNDNLDKKIYVGCTSPIHKLCIEANHGLITWSHVLSKLQDMIMDQQQQQHSSNSDSDSVAEGYLNWTPLRIASESAPVEVISNILHLFQISSQSSSSPSFRSRIVCIKDINHMLALHHAAVNDNYDVIPGLLAACSEYQCYSYGGVREEDYWHRTPLHCLLIRYEDHLPSRVRRNHPSSISASDSDSDSNDTNENTRDSDLLLLSNLKLMLRYDDSDAIANNNHSEDSNENNISTAATLRAIETCDNAQRFPLHIACANRVPVEAIRMLFVAFKKASYIMDVHGMSPVMYLDKWITEEVDKEAECERLESVKSLADNIKDYAQVYHVENE